MKDKIKFEPKPETRGKRGHTEYPWDTIPINGTFYCEDHTEEQAQNIASLIQYYQTKLKKKFSMRTIDGQIKVWRDA